MNLLIYPLINDTSRKIIHIDMDAFFAAVEMRDDPSLSNKVVIIATHPKETGGRGVVSTCNYEARKYGIHSAMSAQEAYKRCPKAVFIPVNMEKYVQASRQVREIFLRYTEQIEPLSIDEAYLDVTQNKIGANSAVKIAKMIQHDIYQELHLTCSAGISYNKFLAKVASDYQKPAGLTLIRPEDAMKFLRHLPIESFYGVGKKSVQRMHELGIFNGEDLLGKSQDFLIKEFGKMGYSLYRKVRGVHNAPVVTTRVRKSVGRERTYRKEITREPIILEEIQKLSAQVASILQKNKKHGTSVVLKIRYQDFSTFTRRKSFRKPISKADEIYRIAKEIYEEVDKTSGSIRLLGVTVTNLTPLAYENIELEL